MPPPPEARSANGSSGPAYWPADLGEWLAWFVPTVLLNVVGGVLLVTVLRLIRSKELLPAKRR